MYILDFSATLITRGIFCKQGEVRKVECKLHNHTLSAMAIHLSYWQSLASEHGCIITFPSKVWWQLFIHAIVYVVLCWQTNPWKVGHGWDLAQIHAIIATICHLSKETVASDPFYKRSGTTLYKIANICVAIKKIIFTPGQKLPHISTAHSMCIWNTLTLRWILEL